MKTILAPIDFSTATGAVVEAASRLALAVNGRVLLLHVVQPPIVTSDYGLAMENLQDVILVSEKAAANRLSELKSKLRPGSAELAVEQASGAPIHEILACAKRTKPDYIVMGSHGHTALYDLIVGGTTHGVLRKAPCPVVVVPPAAPVNA